MFILKNLAFVLTIILSIGIIAFGYISYQNKLNDLATNAETDVTNNTTNSSKEIIETEELQSFGGILGDTYENLESNELKITFLGSEAIQSTLEENNSEIWPSLLIQSLQNNDLSITYEIVNVGKQTTSEILNSTDINEVIDSNPDIIFLESLTLNDNSAVLSTEQSEENLTALLEQMNGQIPNAKVIMFPSNPLLNPSFYLTQIQSLEEFANTNSLLYADHWQQWPDVTDPEIEEYSKSGILSERGHEELAAFMEKFLTE